MLAASVDDEQVRGFAWQTLTPMSFLKLTSSQAESELSEIKSQAKMIFRRLNRNSAPQASIESKQYNLQ